MAKNQVYDRGDKLALAVTDGGPAASGDPVIVGNLPAVATEPTRAVDGLTPLSFVGAYRLAVSNAAAVGDLIAGTKATPVVLTAYANAAAVAAGSIVFGIALAAQAGAGTIPVRLGR